MKTRFFNILVFASILLINPMLGSCSPQQYSYSLMFENESNEQLFDIVLISELGLRIPLRKMTIDSRIIHNGPFKYPPTDTFKIIWRTTSGKEYRATTSFKELLRANFRGYIIFKIQNDNSVKCIGKNKLKGANLFEVFISGVVQ